MFNSSKQPAGAPHSNHSGDLVKGKHLLQQTDSSKDAAAAAAAGVPKVRERKFENGDRYRGGWLNGLPEGEGKYEWSDGSCYEGGWKGGHKHGVGKYTWNSGASYHGEWFNGFMHGVGTFEAPDGSKYQGGWREDLKHGLGRKIYANGDVYEGLWHHGKPDGPGRYIWVDFNEYDGEWRLGRLHGQGTFVWKTGERYDGEWKGGQEDGVGMFTFTDGSTYEGLWQKGKKHGVGIFRPATAVPAPRTLGLRLESNKSGSLGSGSHSASQVASPGRSAFADATAAAAALPDEAAADYMQSQRPSRQAPETEAPACASPAVHQPGKAKSLSSLCTGPSGIQPAASPKARRDQVVLKEYKDGRLMRQQVLSSADITAICSALTAPGSSSSVSGNGVAPTSSSADSSGWQQVSALGEVTYKEHSAYDLLVQLQLGIRWSVTSAALDYQGPAVTQTVLQPPDYATTITQDFPRAGSRSTPVHPAVDFVWKDYAPAAFRMLRELAGVEQHDFINQVCGDQALRLLTPQGRSGTLFFLSADERFLVRTITATEKKLLLSLLQRYAEHIRKFRGSMLSRFYGLHRVSAPKGAVGQKVHFLVMGNIFCTGFQIHRRFDLKGCSKTHTSETAAVKGAGTAVALKDPDLRQRFRLERNTHQKVHQQLEADTRMLSGAGVMDYSMLLGVHLCSATTADSSLEAPPADHQEACNFAEHSTAAELSAAMVRLEQQLGQLHLEKWANAALLQLGRASLLVGLAGSSSKPGSSGRRMQAIRSPTLVLATRPKRNHSRRRPLAGQPAAARQQAPGAVNQAAVHAEAAVPGDAGQLASAMSASTCSASSGTSPESLQQRLGDGVVARALPLTGPLCSRPGPAADEGTAYGAGKERERVVPGQQDALLFFGVIDFLQSYTMRKRVESCMRRVVQPANSISAASPKFYAARFKRAMRKVFV